MFAWNDTFYKESTNYFTLLPLQLFAKKNQNRYLSPALSRTGLLQAIQKYANESADNEEIVNSWIDDTMKEGRREVYIEEYDNDFFTQEHLRDDEYVRTELNNKLLNRDNQHIIGNVYTEHFELVKYTINKTDFGRVITLFMCKLIYCTEDNRKEKNLSAQIYPVVVEIFVDKGYIVTSVKTKANLFLYNSETQNITDLETTTSEKQAYTAKNAVLEMLKINPATENNLDRLKTQLYFLLEACTQTPDEIKQLLNANDDKIINITNVVMNEICQLDNCYEQDVRWDIQNMIEKYFSMTYPDKSIFTKNRIAYPIKLDAIDQQASRVQQISSLEQPLQSKDIFFDNKKMLQKNKKCENVKFSFERKSSLYCNDRFNVFISVNRKYGLIKFAEYTVREDIDNVLHSIIGV